MNNDQDDIAQQISKHAEDMQYARDHQAASPLRGLGTFGMIGWSIAIPTVLGALIGSWLDDRAPRTFSWPVALILGGLSLGCLIAWRWIIHERNNADSQGRQK